MALAKDEVDPIVELVTSLESAGRPELAWVLRWSDEGAEPVRAAWAFARSPRWMRKLIALAGRGWVLEFQEVDALRIERQGSADDGGMVFALVSGFGDVLDRWTVPDHFLSREVAEDLDRRLCDAIRRAVPRPPALAELIEARSAAKSG